MADKTVIGLLTIVLATLLACGGASLLTVVLAWTGLGLMRQQDALMRAARDQEQMEQAALEQEEREREELEKKLREERPYSDCRAQLQHLTERVGAYKLNNGEYPESLQALLQPQPRGGLPFLDKPAQIVDPWGAPFKYDRSGPNNGGKRPDIWSDSPKGKVGNWPKQPAPEHGS
jgi:hypothetical protein